MRRELILFSHGHPVFSCEDSPVGKNTINAHMTAHISYSVAAGRDPDVKVCYRDIPDPVVIPEPTMVNFVNEDLMPTMEAMK